MQLVGGIGAEITLGVLYAGGYVGQVLPVGSEGGVVGYELEVVREAGGAHYFFGYSLALSIIGYYFEGARRVFHVIPHQTVTGLGLVGGVLGLAALALAVHEELGRGVAGIAENGRGLAFAAGPSPVRQQVQGGRGGIPTGAVEVVPVFGPTGQIQDAEVRTV